MTTSTGLASPTAVFNINSGLMWQAMDTYGRVLSHGCAVYTYYFSNNRNIHGEWAGNPLRYFYRQFYLHRAILTDSHFLKEKFIEQYLLTPEQQTRLVALESPVQDFPEPAKAPDPRTRRPQVFWAGRFDRQKRLDIVFSLAERMPDLEFHLWGKPVLDDSFKQLKKPDNVILEGIYRKFSDLPLDKCDLWLYTSSWDGVPNILLDVATSGVPLVGSLVGGTGEILGKGFSWAIDNINDISAYENAIREVIANPDAAREKALALRDYVFRYRSEAAYRQSVKTLLRNSGIYING